MVAIIDYDAGNLTSVARALTHLNYENEITAAPETILAAERVIFPGVGAAKATMETLQQRGLDEVLGEVYRRGTPMLGICIGIQILFKHSDEEDTECLGFLPGHVKKFPTRNASIDNANAAWQEGARGTSTASRTPSERRKVPQIGWKRGASGATAPNF